MRDVLATWPRPQPEMLAPGFDKLDLLNPTRGLLKVSETTVHETEARVDFEDASRYPQRAKFMHSEAGVWQLRSLKFKCPVCFGSGENDGAECAICGGTGWGAS